MTGNKQEGMGGIHKTTQKRLGKEQKKYLDVLGPHTTMPLDDTQLSHPRVRKNPSLVEKSILKTPFKLFLL